MAMDQNKWALAVGLFGSACSLAVPVLIVALILAVLGILFAGVDQEKVNEDMSHGNDGAAFGIAFTFLILVCIGVYCYYTSSFVIGAAFGVLAVLCSLRHISTSWGAAGVALIAGIAMSALQLLLTISIAGWAIWNATRPINSLFIEILIWFFGAFLADAWIKIACSIGGGCAYYLFAAKRSKTTFVA